MADDDRIEALEARLSELSEQQAELRTQLARAQLDQWQGRSPARSNASPRLWRSKYPT